MNKSKKDIGVVLHDRHASFRVWAPFAQAVAATGMFNGWGRTPLASEGDGYWAADVKHVEAGQEYKFVITTPDGREIFRNDPRALHVLTNQGNSVVVDTSFAWESDDFTPPPLNQQVMYELHVGTFNRTDPASPGTFHTVQEKLDYLADLGVNMIELMPIGSMTGDHGWGYASDYIYAIESLYGGRREFLELVKAAHARGIGVVLDVVYNHFGPMNLDLWQFDGWSQDGKGGIYFYNDWRSNTPWGENRPDYGRVEVQSYILDNVRMWMQECHLDGLRVDSTGFIRTVYGHNDDPSNDIPEGWYLLQRINRLARKIKPSAVLIAEDFSGNEYITKPENDGGAGFSAQWEVNLPYVLKSTLESADDAGRNLSFVSSALARRYNGDAFQRVIYSDSHDSDANGAARLSEEISPGNPGSIYAQRRSLLAASIVLTAPGVPMLFQGQEFVEGGSFNDWDALDWTRAEKFKGLVLAHKHLIGLRKNQYGNTRGLTGQSFKILHQNEESKVLSYHRWDQGGAGDDVIIILNFANRTQKDYFVGFPRTGVWRVRFNSDWKGYSSAFKEMPISEVNVEGDGASVQLAPYSVLILSQD